MLRELNIVFNAKKGKLKVTSLKSFKIPLGRQELRHWYKQWVHCCQAPSGTALLYSFYQASVSRSSKRLLFYTTYLDNLYIPFHLIHLYSPQPSCISDWFWHSFHHRRWTCQGSTLLGSSFFWHLHFEVPCESKLLNIGSKPSDIWQMPS